MRKIKLFGVLAILVLGVLAYAGAASAQCCGPGDCDIAPGSSALIPICEDSIIVEVEGSAMCPTDGNSVGCTAYSENRLDVVRGDKVEVRVEFVALADSKNVWVEAFLGGYEYEDFESLSDKTHTFDIKESTRYVKKFTLALPHKLDASEDYKLRILIVDKNGDAIIKNYRLFIDKSRHLLQIRDVVFNPEGSVQAGRALLATARVKNYGDKTEDNVKVTLSIAELGVSASDYIDEIESGESESSEELYLRIPADAKTGDYTAKVTVSYDEDYEKVSKEYIVSVVGSDETAEEDSQATGGLSITVGPEILDVPIGGTGAIYPIVLTNKGSTAKTYVISADSADWATFKISPSNVVVVEKGESKTVYITVAAKPTAQAGEQAFTVSIKSGDKTLKDMLLKANVVGAAKTSVFCLGNLKRGLEIGLVILVVLLVILGLIIGFNKLKGSEEDEQQEESKTYY